MDELDAFYVHTAVVQVAKDTNGNGETIVDESDPFPCFFRDGAKLVRTEQGQSTVGATTLTCNNRYASLFTSDSEVYQVMPDGGKTLKGRVVLTNVADSGDLHLPDHTTVSLV